MEVQPANVAVRDFAGLVLSSAHVSGLVWTALGMVVRYYARLGVREVTLTITESLAEIDIAIQGTNVKRRLVKLQITVEECNRALEAERHSQIDSRLKVEWERRIIELFYQEMAGLE